MCSRRGGELPSLVLKVGHPRLVRPKFLLYDGVKAGALSFDMARSGPANASVSVVGRNETQGGATRDAGAGAYAVRRFQSGRGSILVGGVEAGSITAGRFSFSNGLEAVETIRADGLIEAVDETEATAEDSVTVRFSGADAFIEAGAAETPVALRYRFAMPGDNREPAPVTPETIGDLMRFHGVADAFADLYTRPFRELLVEGNGSGSAPSGISATDPATAAGAGKGTRPAPGEPGG